MQRKLLTIFLSCFIFGELTIAQGRLDNFALAKGDLIENLLFTYYDELGFNGSVLVVEDNTIIYENTFGFSDFENEDPLDATTPFYIASLSKQFTAAGILKLAEQGKLSLDDPLTKYLKRMPKIYNQVKIHHLLTHTGGIPDYFKLNIVKPGISNQDVYQALLSQKHLDFDPGDKFLYSNSGYVLLAMIIEIASGNKIENYFQKDFFTPLKMNNSFVKTTSTDERVIVKGYTNKLKDDDYDLLTVGDGGIYSTARDLFKWEQGLNEGKVISQESLEKAYTSLVLTNGRTRKYGYGWQLGSNTQGELVYHTGGLAGFRTYLERQLNSNNSIIILTNNSFSEVLDLRNTLVKILDGRVDELPTNR